MSDDSDESGDDGDTETAGSWWERAYASETSVPWDTGEPQPAIEALADDGAFASPVLDVGCGLGTHACFLAEAGHDVTGVDVSATAIANARDRAAERGVDVSFAVGDALDLGTPAGVVGEDAAESVLDVGALHTFDGDRRGEYVDALGRVLAPDGRAFVLSFGPDAPADWPPNRIGRDDVHAAFDDDWRVAECSDEIFVTRDGDVHALLAVLEREG